jgi:hypothetical protein
MIPLQSREEDGLKTLRAILPLVLLGAGVASLGAGTICPDPTNCTLVLDTSNGSSNFGTGDFGTVNLALDSMTNTITVTIALAPDWLIIKTGAGAGSVGFDSLGGGLNNLSGLTIGNFSSAQFSGSASDATNDLHFDDFGYANNAAGTSGPKAGTSTANTLSFTVSDGTALTNVNQLVNPFYNGSQLTYFTVDAVAPNGGNTGLLGTDGRLSGVPEPATGALLALGGVLLFGLRFRFAKK